VIECEGAFDRQISGLDSIGCLALDPSDASKKHKTKHVLIVTESKY
jgi:hypothetical protein